MPGKNYVHKQECKCPKLKDFPFTMVNPENMRAVGIIWTAKVVVWNI